MKKRSDIYISELRCGECGAVFPIPRMKQTALKGRQDVWLSNLTSLKRGEFGIDTKSPETLLAYWKAQAEAGYPLADENVRYFEDMVRKESGNG